MRKKTLLSALSATFLGTLLLSAIGNGMSGSGISKKDTEKAPPVKELPYFTDFEDKTDFDDWMVFNANEDYTWCWQENYTLGGHAELSQFNGVTPSDNWLLSPGFELSSTTTYRLQFYVMNWFDADMNVYVLDSSDVETAKKELLYKYVGSEWGVKTLEFTPESSGTYFIGFHDVSPWGHNDTALYFQLYIDNFRMEALSNNAVPGTVGDLRQIPGENGEVSMSLEWTNPVWSKMGEELDGLSKATVYKDGQAAETFETGVIPGEKMRWTDPSPTAGTHTYGVVISNTTGDSDMAAVDTFIGIDMPGAPVNLSVDYDADGGVITIDWEEPEFGAKGGWFDKEGISYRIVRQPGNKVLAVSLDDEMYEDMDLDEYGNYIYQVTTRTDAGIGATAISKGVLAGKAATLPVVQGWETPDSYVAWELADNNSDGHTMHVKHAMGHESPSCLIYDYNTTDVERDETLYSPPVYLEKGKEYEMSVWGANTLYQTFCLDMTYGKEREKSAQTNRVATFSDEATGGAYNLYQARFTAKDTGIYYFAWRLFNVSSRSTWFDDFKVSEVLDNNITATAVSNLNTSPTAGDEMVTSVTYVNSGSKKSSGFTVQLIDDDDAVLAEQRVTRAIASGASGNASLKWTVPDVSGKFSVRGRVVMEGDECIADNTTEPSRITVLERGWRGVTIGTSTNVSDNLPFTYYGDVLSESIYLAEDFGGLAGVIRSMKIKVCFGMGHDYPALPYKVYLGNTAENNLAKGWINANRLTKVFDGPIDFNCGAYELEIPFDNPFMYAGGNLCLLIVGDHNAATMLDEGYGLGTFVSEYGLCSSRVWSSFYTKADENNIEQYKGNYSSSVPNVIFNIDHTKTCAVAGTVTDIDGNPMEGATVCGSSYPDLKGVTDADGRYSIPYFPSGYAYMRAAKTGYQDGNGYAMLEAGSEGTIDVAGMTPLVNVLFKGSVVDARDGETPVAGAEIYLSGENTLTALTDDEGRFEIEGVYAFKPYPVFFISKDGYQTEDYGGMTFRGSPEYPYEWNDITLNPVTASPYSVTALDRDDIAEISWDTPIEEVTASKGGEESVGAFGGAWELVVGHRYSPEEIASLGIDGKYFVKSISFVPMCQSSFKIAIWQGEYGNEAKVYEEDVRPSQIESWNEFQLKTPFLIDPGQSIVVGYEVDALSGAFPVGFDRGPLVEGGDCLFDDSMNTWSSAHEVLPQSMRYNWAIRAKFGNDPNSAAVEWAQPKGTPERVMQLGEVMALASGLESARENISASTDKLGCIMLESPVAYRPVHKIAPRNEIKGYNIYRLEPGQEAAYIGSWTQVNDEPIIGNSFSDKSWCGAEDKPYRFAVTSFYGNPYPWGSGIMSDPTFSDGVDKGRYSTVTLTLNADKGDASDATVMLSGDGKTFIGKTEDGGNKVTFEDVRFADYTVLVSKPYYRRIHESVTVGEKNTSLEYDLVFDPKSPENFDAKDYIKEARLSWTVPTTSDNSELRLGNDEMYMTYALNPGTETICGQRSTAAERADLAYGDFWISGIRFFASAAVKYSPLVWIENKFGSQVEVRRKDYTVTDEEVGSWITVLFDEPILLDKESTYYYGYSSVAPDYDTETVAVDEGPWTPGGLMFYMYDQKDYRYRWLSINGPGNIMTAALVTDTPDPSMAKSIDATFDIYRLPANSADDESAWTKVNSNPVEGSAFIDTDWALQPDQDWKYAVKSVFYGDTESEASLSKTLAKGKVSLVTVDLATDNGLSAEGIQALVTNINGTVLAKGVTDSEGHVEIPEVAKNKSCRLKVNARGFETVDESFKSSDDYVDFTITLNEVKEAPGFVEAYPSSDNSEVEISWRKPGEYAPAQGWAHWDNGRPYGGYGTSSEFCAAAQCFEPEDLREKGMTELDITRISFFPTSSSSNPVDPNSYWTAKIWRINSDMTVTEVASQNAADVTLDTWNEVILDNPYHLDGTETILVGYEFHGAGNALGVDDGPVARNKGDWANFGDGWVTLSSYADGFNFNNLIHAYCEHLGYRDYVKAPALSTPQPMKAGHAKVSVSRLECASKASAHEAIDAYEYPVKGYLVFRMPDSKMDDESAWTPLTSEAIPSTSLADVDWSNVPDGAFRWAVKAVYATGESDPVFCQFSLTSDGHYTAVDSFSGDIRLSCVSKGKVLVELPVEGRLEAFGADGTVILTRNLSEGSNLVSVDADGVCLFRVECGGDTRTFKVIM